MLAGGGRGGEGEGGEEGERGREGEQGKGRERRLTEAGGRGRGQKEEKGGREKESKRRGIRVRQNQSVFSCINVHTASPLAAKAVVIPVHP